MMKKKEAVKSNNFLFAIVSLVLIITISVGVTLAILKENSNSVLNTFIGTTREIKITEDFSDGETKKNVGVINTGSSPVFARIKLISYRVNSDGDYIGGNADIELDDADIGTGWISMGDGVYIYSKIIEPSTDPSVSNIPYLIGEKGIKLKKYNDEDGGNQVVEVIAECVQSNLPLQVEDAWGVSISNGVISKKS